MIMEAQRLFSVAPVAVPHRTMKDCDVLGHKIPKVVANNLIHTKNKNKLILRIQLCY